MKSKPSRLYAGDIETGLLDFLHREYFDTDTDLPLYFYSQGGDVGVAAAAVDLILTQKKPTTLIAIGEVGSAGVMVFLAAEKRLATLNARFFFHPSSIHAKLSVDEMRTEIKELEAREALLSSLWALRGCGPCATLLTGTFYMNAPEAKTYKLVEDIVKLRL